jgi:hypothetical protein
VRGSGEVVALLTAMRSITYMAGGCRLLERVHLEAA